MGVRDAIEALKKIIIIDERIAQLADEVAGQSRSVREELGEIRREQRDLRDRVSRIEGGFAVIERLRLRDR